MDPKMKVKDLMKEWYELRNKFLCFDDHIIGMEFALTRKEGEKESEEVKDYVWVVAQLQHIVNRLDKAGIK